MGRKNGKPGCLLAHHEDVHFTADAAVVALFGLFEVMQVLVQIGLLEECRAVQTLQLLAVGVAAPIGPGKLHHLESADLAGGGNMRARAQVNKVAMAVDGDLLVGQVVDVLKLEALVGEDFLRPLDGNHFAHEGLVLLHNLGHLLLDCREIVRRDVLGQLEIVEIAVVGSGTEGNLRPWEQLLYRFRHDMRAGMAHDGKSLGALIGNDLDGCAVGYRSGNIHQLAVNLAGKRSFSKTGAR